MIQANFKTPSGTYSDVGKMTLAGNVGVVPNQRVRIPVVPMDIKYEKTKEDILVDELNQLGATRELLVDYTNGHIIIKDGERLINITDVITSNAYENLDQFKVYYNNTKVTIQEAIQLINDQKISLRPALLQDPLYVVDKAGMKISMAPDGVSTELLDIDGVTDSTGVFNLQVKGFNDAETNQYPIKDESGNVKWVDRADEVMLKNYETAEDESIPIKINGEIRWVKRTDEGYLDIDAVKDEISRQVNTIKNDEGIIYAVPVSHEMIVGVGLSQLTVESIEGDLTHIREDIESLRRTNKNEQFSNNVRLNAIANTLSNQIIENFDDEYIDGDAVNGSAITLDLDNQTLIAEKPLTGYDIKLFPTTLNTYCETFSLIFSAEYIGSLDFDIVIETNNDIISASIGLDTVSNVRVYDTIKNFYIKVDSDQDSFSINHMGLSYSVFGGE